MAITIPTNVAYPNPIVALPTNMLDDPTEGRKFIPLELTWGIMGGSAKCINVNLTANAYLDFRKISALWVDNSQCGQDVTFIFPTISTTVVVPAYESVMVPVAANATEFYVSCAAALAVDVTRLDIFNHVPPPVVLPKTAFQSVAVVAAGAFVVGTLQVIPATVIGTLENLYIQPTWNTTAAFAAPMTVRDGAINTIASYQFDGANPSQSSQVVAMENLNVRFNGGLQIVVAGTVPNVGTLSVNAYYRSP